MLKLLKGLLKKESEITLSKNYLSQDEIDYKNNMLQEIYDLLEPTINKDQKIWTDLKPKILDEANQQILIARSLGVTPQDLANKRTEVLNAELEHKRLVMKNGYSLTLEDHLSVFLPICKNINLIPNLDTVVFSGRKVGDILYEASSSDYRTSKDAQDELMGFCNLHAVVELVKKIRKNYETACRAKDAGYSKFRLATYRKCCQKCQNLDGQEIGIDSLLNGYKSGNLQFPHEIFLEDSDEVDYCLGPSLIFLEDENQDPRYDLWDLRISRYF